MTKHFLKTLTIFAIIIIIGLIGIFLLTGSDKNGELTNTPNSAVAK